MGPVRLLCHRYQDRMVGHSDRFRGFQEDCQRGTPLLHPCPSNPRLDRSQSLLACRYHHPSLCHSPARNLSPGLRLAGNWEDLHSRLNWYLLAYRSRGFHRYHRLHPTCPTVRRYRHRCQQSLGCHRCHYLDRRNLEFHRHRDPHPPPE